jgi:putative ABC transport system permease protein
MRALQTFWEGFRVAWDTLIANPLRSGLTVMGVAIGVAVVMIIAAFVSGIRSSVMEGLESAGPRNFIVTKFDVTAPTLSEGPPSWMAWPDITPLEAREVARLPGVDEALYNFAFGVTMEFEGRRVEGITSQGYSSGWPRYSPGDFVAGRDFTPAEVSQARAVMVLSDELASELFGQRDPVGRRVGVESPFRSIREDFTVIGVFEPEANIFAEATPHWAVFPYSAALKRLDAPDSQAQILVVPDDSANVARVKDRVVGLMRGRRGLGPREESNFALLESAQLLALFDRLTGVFFLVMLALSSVALMVGGVGVIGIMLISVTERTREIGIRKAVGATRREILWQFLVEAAVLTVLGGAIGMAVGAGIAELIEARTPIPASVPLWSVIAALGAAAITGVLFGLVPAYRAARLDPVAAIRYE